MKRKTKIALLAGIAAIATLLCTSCAKKIPTFTGKKTTFEPGTHYISMPLETDLRPAIDQIQAYCPEGYRIVSNGLATSNTEVLLYENVVKVECFETTDGYNQFGTPVYELKLTE